MNQGFNERTLTEVVSPTQQAFSWNESSGRAACHRPSGKIIRVDLDLCDPESSVPFEQALEDRLARLDHWTGGQWRKRTPANSPQLDCTFF